MGESLQQVGGVLAARAFHALGGEVVPGAPLVGQGVFGLFGKGAFAERHLLSGGVGPGEHRGQDGVIVIVPAGQLVGKPGEDSGVAALHVRVAVGGVFKACHG